MKIKKIISVILAVCYFSITLSMAAYAGEMDNQTSFNQAIH